MTSGGVLVVDAANVVGSRPDGWWRDRPGAARRLVDELRGAALIDVVVVLEGAARTGAAETASAGVRVVHAPGSGDDEVVRQVEAAGRGDVTVVTSDRGLRARVADRDARVVGPRWLRERMSGGGRDS